MGGFERWEQWVGKAICPKTGGNGLSYLPNRFETKLIKEKYPDVKTLVTVKDFGDSFQEDFFTPIKEQLEKIKNVAICINNVGHRTGWAPYHEMPSEEINVTIACGTDVQARLTHSVIPYFLQRKKEEYKSLLLNMTAQCVHPNYFLGNNFS